jgi:outer membrane biogenesis lipoprotein LolB
MIAARHRYLRALAALVAVCATAACAARRTGFVPPASGGVPAPDAAVLVASAQQSCDGLRSLTAQAALRGSLAGQRVRGRLDLGLTAEGRVRLEAVAPFGLLFVLAGDESRATLLLTREGRVLRDQPAAEIVEALAGVRIAPATLLQIVAGCPATGGAVTGGQRFPNGIVEARAGTDRTVWLQPGASLPRVVAARLGDVLVEYPAAFSGTEPRALSLRRPRGNGLTDVDLQLTVSQIEWNGAIDPAAFAVTIPAEAQPITLDDLRRAGPLTGR